MTRVLAPIRPRAEALACAVIVVVATRARRAANRRLQRLAHTPVRRWQR